MTALVLASRSPRRAELLKTLGVSFRVAPADIDESRHPDEDPHALVSRLARTKAQTLAGPGAVVIGADTVVVHDGTVLGKPVHPAEARAMLSRLSGSVHLVLTAVAVAGVEGGEVVSEVVVESARVRFLQLTGAEIAAYVATGEPLDKAGAYAIQGKGAVFVEKIEGHPSTVVGLPLPATRRLLARRGITVVA
ncbi:MAG: Maf family protein [Acidimicrobiia bacterium]